jgi:type VI secretion system ImpA family protein
MSQTIDLQKLTKPISASSPSGENVYESVHRQIEEARSPSAEPGSKPRGPDWKKVLELGTKALENKTKDLQIAAYITEALGWLEGLDGLRQGFELLRMIQTEFWTSMFPLYETNDDPGDRVSPYEFIDEVLPQILYLAIPLANAPRIGNFNLQQFIDVNQTGDQLESRNDAIRRTETSFHLRLSEDLDACNAAFNAWKSGTIKLMDTHAPSLHNVSTVLHKLNSCLRIIESVRPFLPAPAAPLAAQTGGEIDRTASPGITGGTSDMGVESQTLDGAAAEWERGTQGNSLNPEASAAQSAKDVAALATQLANSGRLDAAVKLLDGARQSTRCRRDRFIRQLELVELCLSRGLGHVARPLVDELLSVQEEKGLENWEDPALCARVLIATVACLRATNADHDTQRVPGILERLYRLDPRSALRRELMP